MGKEEDPKDGAKVAATVFSAVAVYGVSMLMLSVEQADNSGRHS